MSSTGCVVGEGPLWSPSEQLLWWVDIKRAKLHRFNPSTGNTRRYDLPLKASALAIRQGGLVMIGNREIGVFDPATEAYERKLLLEDGPGAGETNDGGMAPDGCFWFGTMDGPEATRPGAYFRLTPEFEVERLPHAAVAVPNFMGFSPDGATFYTCDTAEQEILAYDRDPVTGALSGRRVFATTTKIGGYPDGGAVDAVGRLWICHFGAGQVVCYEPDGRIAEIVRLPVSRPTSCAFGGADRRTLFITTSRIGIEGDDLEAEPFAGGLFAVEVDMPGLRVPELGAVSS